MGFDISHSSGLGTEKALLRHELTRSGWPMLPFFHPTTVLVLDDDPLFLESLQHRYGALFNCQVTRTPDEAMALLERAEALRQADGNLLVPHTNALDGDPADPWILQVRASLLPQMADWPERCGVISVAIVDFSMPSMTGVEFCRRIQHLPVRRLLLTGKTGDETAVSAFNEGLIDVFLVKHDKQITAKLPREIERLQRLFFSRITSPLGILAKVRELAFLEDANVQAHFAAVCTAHDITEYYLSCRPTGFLLTGRQGRRYQFIVYDSDTMRAQWEVAAAGGAPRPLVDLLELRQAIAAFPTVTGFFEPAFMTEWEKFTFPAERIGEGDRAWWIALAPEGEAAPFN